MIKNLKDTKAITLIALIITIIILMILAGVSINLTLGSNGLIKRAQDAKQQTTTAADEEELRIAKQEYIISKMEEGSSKTFIQFLEEKGYGILDVSDDGNEASIIVNGKVYSLNENDESLTYIREATQQEIKSPRITSLNAKLIDGNKIGVEISLKDETGVSYKYTLRKNGSDDVISEKTEKNPVFENLDLYTTYEITIEITNEYGTTTRKVKVKTISLSEITQGKASFSISPSTGVQEKVTATIESQFEQGNSLLQYSIGKNSNGEFNWQSYTGGFEVNKNTTLYGRFYDSAADETGYAFTFNVTNIDEEPPTLSVTNIESTGKTVSVTVGATDNLAMGANPEYTFYIGTSDGNYIAEKTATKNSNSHTFTGLSKQTKYYIKVQTADKKGNIGFVTDNITTTNPITVERITLNKSNALIGTGRELQLSITSIESEYPNNTPPPDDTSVTWSIASGTGATVDQSGRVTAGSEETTVTVRATANDRRGEQDEVYAECVVEIINATFISNAEQLKVLCTYNTALNGKYFLTDDIDLSETTWRCPDYNCLRGEFDGCGHTIYGMHGQTALFTTIDGGTVKNVKFENVNLGEGGTFDEIGVICQALDGGAKVENCGAASGVITGGNSGSLAGYGSNFTMSNCYSKLNFTSNIGWSGSLVGCYNNSGGNATFTNCYYVGSFASGSDNSAIYRCGYWNKWTSNNCFYNIDLFTPDQTGDYRNPNVLGKTTAEMKTQSTYTNWDFTNTWVMGSDGYPELRVFVH